MGSSKLGNALRGKLWVQYQETEFCQNIICVCVLCAQGLARKCQVTEILYDVE